MRGLYIGLACAISSGSASAQTATGTAGAAAAGATVLPDIVVEGATLQTKPAVMRRRQDAQGDDAPARRPAASGTDGAAGEPGTANPAPADTTGSANAAGQSTFDGAVTTDRLGVSVTVVTGEDLRQQQVRYAADALRSLPGVEVNRTSTPGSATEVRIRGAEAYHTTVLIDGIDVKDPSTGEFDFSDMSAEDIERIEVIRGPSSGLYGANALGGVINIITKTGKGPLTVTAKTEFGAFGTKDAAVALSGGNDKAHIAISYHERDSTGFNISPFGSEKDGSKLGTFSFKGGVMLTDTVSLDVTARNMNKQVDRDGFGGSGGAPGALATAIDEASHSASNTWIAGTNLKWDMLDGKLTHVLRASYKSTDLKDYDLSASPGFTENRGETFTYAYLATYRFDTPALFGAKHTVTGLVEKEKESFHAFDNFPDPFFPIFIDGPTHERQRLAVAGEYRGEFAGRLDVTAAVRHDAPDTFIDFTTWRTSASLRLPDGLRPHASVGTGVRLPTMFQQFGFNPNFFRGNPGLQPERSLGWDAGMEFTLAKGRAVLDATYFHADVANKISTVGFPVETPVNLQGESLRQGIELSGRFKLSPYVTLGTAYTFLDAEDPSGLHEVRRPPHSGRVDLNYAFDQGRGNVRLAAIYNGQMIDTAFRADTFAQERVSLDAYWNLTLAGSYEVQKGVEIFGRVENLLNQHYQEVYGFNTAGIAAYAGVKVQLSADDAIKSAKP